MKFNQDQYQRAQQLEMHQQSQLPITQVQTQQQQQYHTNLPQSDIYDSLPSRVGEIDESHVSITDLFQISLSYIFLGKIK